MHCKPYEKRTYNIFQWGVDEIPDWFSDAVDEEIAQVIVDNADPVELHAEIKLDDNNWRPVLNGDYILRTIETGAIFAMSKEVFDELVADSLFEEVEDDE